MQGKDFELLQETLTPEFSGVLWITREGLQTCPRPFHVLDYLLDGLLVLDQFGGERKKNVRNFFVSSNFGLPFFVAHLEKKSATEDEDIAELVKLVRSVNTMNRVVLVLEQPAGEYYAKIQRRFPEVQIRQLVLP